MQDNKDQLFSQDNSIASSETSNQSLQKCKQRELLDKIVVEVILSSEGRDVHNILPFISRTLRQFKLNSYYEEYDVFSEAYRRAVKHIALDKPIHNIPMWLKGASLNIVREFSRDKAKQTKLSNVIKNQGETICYEDDIIPEYAISSTLKALIQAFNNLKPQESLILRLRIVEGRTWKEIGEHLVAIGEETENNQKLEEKLRQRGKRLLERLRKYCSLK